MGKKDDDCVVKKGENDMQATLERKTTDLQASIKKIGSKIPIIGGPKGKIKLNPKDEGHRDWYEDDGDITTNLKNQFILGEIQGC